MSGTDSNGGVVGPTWSTATVNVTGAPTPAAITLRRSRWRPVVPPWTPRACS